MGLRQLCREAVGLWRGEGWLQELLGGQVQHRRWWWRQVGLRGSLGWAEEQGIGTPMAGLAVAQLLLHTLGRCRQGLQDLGSKMGTLRLGPAARASTGSTKS